MNWKDYAEIHDAIVLEAIALYGGIAFARAPFDLIDSKGRFIEVKKCKTHKDGYPRCRLSGEELKFATLKRVFLYAKWGERAVLVPLSGKLLRRLLGRKLEHRVYNGRSWFGIDVSLTRYFSPKKKR